MQADPVVSFRYRTLITLNLLFVDGHNKVFLREEVEFGCPLSDSSVAFLLTVVRVVSGRDGQSRQEQNSLLHLYFLVEK